MEEISGIVERILFFNPENSYAVFELSDGSEKYTLTGTLPLLIPGEHIAAKGRITVHNQYGEQYVVESCVRSLPSTLEQMYRFLCEGGINGVGPAIAMRIVDKFEEETFDVLMSDPDRLSQIKGITSEKALEITTAFEHDMSKRSVILTFGDIGIDAEYAFRAFDAWGSSALNHLENPYELCDEPIGLPFQTAEQISRTQGIPDDDFCRIRAGILYVLKHNAQNDGHSCLPADKLIPVSSGRLGIDSDSVEDALYDMADEGILVAAELDGREYIFLKSNYSDEFYIGQRLNDLSHTVFPNTLDIDAEIDKMQKSQLIEFEEKQRAAIKSAAESGIFVLTGGPGTGKTTTTKAIIKVLARQGCKIKVCAPTGRAAKRLSELSGRKASTIHKLLEVRTFRGQSVYSRNENNRLECDAIIVDEISMVDINLFSALLKALKPSCRIVLVGDKNQLPSIGCGNILKDILSADKVFSVELVHIFRQAMQSLIVTNAHKINNGEMPDLSTKDNDFFFLKCSDKQSGMSTIVDLYTRRLPSSYGYNPIEEIQILSPNKKGEAGTIELNIKIQSVLNPQTAGKSEFKGPVYTLREGDKVMQTRNNYQIRCISEEKETTSVFNGDMGIIERIDSVASVIYVSVEGEMLMYSYDEAVELELAYAVTVHKSQGCEFEAVVIPLFEGPRPLYFRKLLYTAVTRAKSLLILVGKASVIEYMVNCNIQSNRYTALKFFIKE